MSAPNPQGLWDHPPAFPQLCAYLAERAPQPMAAVEGLTHIIRYINPAFCTLLGRAASDFTGRRFADAIPEGDQNGCPALLDRAFRTGTHEVLAEQPHGTIPGVFWSYSAWAILGADSEPVGVAVQVTDASEIAGFRHRLTEFNQALLVSSLEQHENAAKLAVELQSAERLASIGTLAAGIGHDIGNLLLSIRMRLSAMERDMLPHQHEDLAALRSPIDYLQRLTNNLRLLALDPTKPATSGERTDLGEWWSDIVPLLRISLPPAVALHETTPEPGALPAVAIAPPALAQVLFNLVQNAGEAIAGAEPRTGRVHVSVARADPPAGSDVPRVLISVADDGPGMSPEVLRHCMDPFFSTKARRISTGMGLSLVRSHIRKANGDIRVRSRPGHGTTFTIDLPAAPPAPESHQPGPGQAGERRPCRAAVTLASRQAMAYVRWVLVGEGAEVAPHESATTTPDADLWIVEPREGIADSLREFLRDVDGCAAQRSVVIYGDPADALAAAAIGPLASSITFTGAEGLPSRARPHLERAVRESGPRAP